MTASSHKGGWHASERVSHVLPLGEMEYTTMPEIMKKLEGC